MLSTEDPNTNREMLNPLTSSGKQLLSDIVTRNQEFNVLQTTEQAGDVLDLLESQFFEVLSSCDDSHLGLLKTYLEGKLVLEHGERRDLNAINARNILSYFDKLSKIEDQRKCLEICASLLNDVQVTSWGGEPENEVVKLPPTGDNRPISSRVKTPLGSNRAQSASRSSDTILRRDHSALLNAYETTYDRQFSRPMTAVSIVRPRSAYPSASDELSELRKHYTSTYSTQFYEKEPARTAPIRSGSGSGHRRNNPHPLRSFMIYQLPKSQPLGLMVPQLPEFGDRTIESAIRGKTTSTYHQNYLGLPPGVNIKSAFKAERDASKSADVTKLQRSNSFYETTTGRVFTNPESPELLKQDNYTRHGCNYNLGKVARAIVPNASRRQPMNPFSGRFTTYDSEFIPRPLPKERATRRPPAREKLLCEIEQVPHHLIEKDFVINRSEIINFARENNAANKSEKSTEATQPDKE
ncbi:uncharacterized protein LOC142339914 [Convolutriloba macropyga]|uniref:uncharacterized protein LOC142339914 n=1 Tax=Convolutriloba macropyga TaxID=536237 RepID=UPI003F51C6DD